jgi:hypothetical protein
MRMMRAASIRITARAASSPPRGIRTAFRSRDCAALAAQSEADTCTLSARGMMMRTTPFRATIRHDC